MKSARQPEQGGMQHNAMMAAPTRIAAASAQSVAEDSAMPKSILYAFDRVLQHAAR